YLFSYLLSFSHVDVSLWFPSPAFQRFAVRTSKRIEDISSKAVQKRQELAEQIKDISKNMEV
ncbi:hypothetical protein CR513_04140, partial [Mucuna pruriens]